MRASLLLAAICLAAIGPARADDGDQVRARAALESGEVRPLTEVLAAGRAAVPGDIVAVKLKQERGGWFYELKILSPSGRRHEVEIDAQSLAVIEIEEDS